MGKKNTRADFYSQIIEGPNDECWLWGGFIEQHGYGSFRFEGKRHKAHRLSWILSKGPIPDGLMICHKCDNPPCVNPNHLFLGTASDNNRDMGAKNRSYGQQKTHCPHGHEYTKENTIMTGKRKTERKCRACKKIENSKRTPSLKLISRPKKMITEIVEAWANISEDGSVDYWTDKEMADEYPADRVACVKLTGTYEVEET